MFFQQVPAIIDSLAAIIDTLIGVTGAFPVCNLFMNNYTPTPTTQLSDLTVATYTGYAPVTLTAWQSPSWQSQGVAITYANQCVFTPTASTVTNTIYGYYLTTDSGAILLGAERFAVPVNLTDTTTSLTVVPTWGISDGGVTSIIY